MDFVKWEKWNEKSGTKKVERKKWNEKSGTEKHYESITAIKKKIKMVFGFVIFQPCKIGS